jgi:hypothetical protein
MEDLEKVVNVNRRRGVYHWCWGVCVEDVVRPFGESVLCACCIVGELSFFFVRPFFFFFVFASSSAVISSS